MPEAEPLKFLETPRGEADAETVDPNRARGIITTPSAPDWDRQTFTPEASLLEAIKPPPAGSKITVTVQESSFSRRRPRQVEVKLTAESTVKQFKEALQAKRAKFAETDTFSTDLDNVGRFFSAEGDGTFLQMLGGPFSKQLYLADYLKMHAECFFELHHNPLARLAVQMFTDFVVGRGVSVKCEDERMQEGVDNWFEEDNGHQRIAQAHFDLSWQGEITHRLYVKSAADGGGITVLPIDPSTLWEKITLPSNVEKVYGWWQVYPGPFNIQSMIVDGKQVPMTSYTYKIIPADEILHVMVNVASGEKRGRSDLFPGLPWLKRIRDYLAVSTEAAKYVDAFAWDVLVKGNAGDVSNAMSDPSVQKVPRPGSAWWHNQAIEVTPMSSKTGSYSGRDLIVKQLVSMFAAAFGIPLEFLPFHEGGGTKATAIAATSPWAKRVQNRQFLMETSFIKPLVTKLRDALVAIGRLPAGTSAKCEITWPEPAPEDVDVRMKRLAFLKAEGVIDDETFATMCAAEANITTYDYATMKAKVDKQRADAAARGDASLNDKAALLARARGLGGAGNMSSPDKNAARQDSSSLTGKGDTDLADTGMDT